MRWEELPMASRARLMAAAVRNGYTDIRSIKEAYANYQDLKLTTGNRFDEGGDTDEPEVVNLLDKLPIWKALEKIDYTAIPDPEFTREKTGAGSIEYFSADEPEGITYNNGYHRDHPMPGRDVILYNPNTNDEQDIRLDALHIMSKDPTYDALNSLYREAAREGDVAWAAEQRYKEDLEKYGLDNLDSREQYFNNEADGLLRNMFIEGTPEYIESKHYHQNKDELRQWNAHLMPYINRIEQYLKTGERPADILPELVVTNLKAYGGNLFEGGGDVKGVRGFLNLLKKHGINVIETSGYRKGAVTKSGHASFHSMLDKWGNAKAQDFKPADGDWNKLRRDIYRNPELVQYMLDNNIGILEENTPEAQKKYGTKSKDGKGVWHIGGDTAAKRDRDNNISIFGTTYHPMQDVTWADVQARKRRFELSPEEERLYNSKPTLFYNADYADWNDPSTKETFEQAYAPYALNSELDNDYSNGWALYNSLLQSQALSDPLSWMTMMASLSPKTTYQLKEAANTMYQLFAPQGDDYMYHGLNFAAYGGKVNKFDDAGRIITLADLPREYVQKYGHINVVTPKGVRMPLSQAYRDYNQTPINANDVPGLTDYLIKQDQPDISEQAHIDKVAADRKVHQLGEERDKALIGLAAAITGGGALASGLALAPVATIGSTIGGIAGEKAFNAGYEKLTGNNWGQDVERWTKGYIPEEYGEYLNPGTLIGGITGDVASKVGKKILNTAFLSKAMNKSIGIIPDNVYINRLNSVPLITKENAKLIPDYIWDDAYFKAINAKDIVEAQRLRDLHFASKANYTPVTIDSQGNPITWYTGSEFGNHSVFDSSKMNATIGGSSIRGEKGNFTTTDLPAAEHYAGINRFSDRNVQEYTTPETIKEKVLDFFGLYKPKFIHPVDRIPKEVSPDLKSLYNTGSQSVLDRIQSGQKVDKVVYPLYINGNKLRQVDFEGRPWSRVPDNVEINNRYVVEEYTPNGGYDYFIPNKTREYLNKEDAVRDYDSMTGTHGTMENGIVNKQDPSTLENKNFDWHNGQQVRSVMEFASKPSFNKAILKEIRTPRTTNGLVQDSFRKDYDLVYMKDVIDSNGGINGESYAIDDLVTRYSNQMKLANAITYDDAGNVIPLSKRDNFNIKDIRYGWLLPFGITLGAGAVANSQAYGGPINAFAGGSNKPNAADTTGGIAANLGVNLTQQQIEWNKKALGGHLYDKAGPITNQTQYMLMKPQTLKLLNPVTFDDTGNIIPLSLRFNLDIYDTRYAEGGNLFRKGGKKNNTVSVGGVTAGSKAGTEQCAKYSNSYLRDNGYIANGNAWNQGGGSVVFSGYDGLERPAVFDKKAVEAYNNAASDNVWNNFDSNTLDKDSVYTVNMYYKGSPYLEEAYKNGTKGRTGTHTGYLKYENGDWYVVHNIHGKVHVDRFKNIQGGNKKYGVTGIYAPRTNNIFNRAITKLGFGYGGNLFYKGGLEDQFANTYLGIGQFPDYDSDFIATNNLQYLPYSQLNMMGRNPEDIRIGNQGNQTMYAYDDKDATYLADANGNLVTSPLLHLMTLDYVKEHYGPMLLKAFLSNPDKYWDEYNRYRTNSITFDENGNPVSSGLPPIEKPIEPAAPEFWLLSAGASKAPSALNSVVSPLFNMAAVDNVIDDVTPYTSFGNLMSENVGGPEWAWNLIHPAIAKDLWNLSKTAGKYIYNKVTKPNLTLTSDGSNVTYEMGANIDSPYRLESDHAATDLYKKMLQKEYYDFLRTGKMPETEYTLIDKDIVNSGYEETGLGEDVVNKLIHDTLGRRKIAHQSLSDSDRAYYEMNELDHDMQNIENAAERLKNIRVGTYDADVFNHAGIDEDVQGMHFSEFGEDPSSIIIKLGEKDIPAIKRHEGEHEIDEFIELTPEQKKKLKNAYDQDFVGLPDRVPEDDALFGYENMEAERTTTNGDARDIVLKHHAGTTDIYLQNKIIDKTSDEKIFEAVEKANGYGRRYITWLREHNKLTPKKALEFREAMKIAGITGIVAGTIYPTSL